MKRLKAVSYEMAKFKGKLGKPEELKKYLDLQLEVEESLSKAYSYASMKSHLNFKDVTLQEDLVKVTNILNELVQNTSFESPEIISLGEEYINKFLNDNPKYKQFTFSYQKLFRLQKHVLSASLEEQLSLFNQVLNEGSKLYDMLSAADGKEKIVKLSDNREVQVTQGNWRNLIAELKDPNDRKLVFEAIFSSYEANKNTYAEIYNTVMQSELAYARAKKYPSIIEAHLFPNNIPLEVFTSLIEVTSTHTEALKKYYELRRKYLHLDVHHTYDRFIQLASSNKKYTYDQAKEFFFESIDKFPEDFKNKAREVTKDGYVDVYEKEGKRSGAYSTGGSNMHPFILLNFDGALDDVFTLAHESGHSIHTLYSMEGQPLMTQGYTIFVAEIASTFNEHNLLDFMIEKGELSKEEKIMLLQKSIDEICSTFYRQALFGQYEYEVSKLVEKGEGLNYQVLSKIMVDLYKQYYGLDITTERVKEYVWAYIPHLFHTPFYVYQYATSFASSMKIYENVKSGKKDAFNKYIELLKSGGSDYPVNQVKKAGVDLTKKDAYLAVANRLTELVDELEKVLESK